MHVLVCDYFRGGRFLIVNCFPFTFFVSSARQKGVNFTRSHNRSINATKKQMKWKIWIKKEIEKREPFSVLYQFVFCELNKSRLINQLMNSFHSSWALKESTIENNWFSVASARVSIDLLNGKSTQQLIK